MEIPTAGSVWFRCKGDVAPELKKANILVLSVQESCDFGVEQDVWFRLIGVSNDQQLFRTKLSIFLEEHLELNSVF